MAVRATRPKPSVNAEEVRHTDMVRLGIKKPVVPGGAHGEDLTPREIERTLLFAELRGMPVPEAEDFP